MDVDAKPVEDRHILGDLSVGEPVLGDGAADHSARVRLGLEDGDAKACVAEALGGSQPSRAGTDDRDPPRAALHLWEHHRSVLLVHDVSLDLPNRKRLVVVGAHARALAQVIAHPSQDGGQWVIGAGDLDRIQEIALAYGTHVGRDVLVDRAPVDARGLDAVEQVELAVRLRVIHAKRVLLVAPVGAHRIGVCLQIDPG